MSADADSIFVLHVDDEPDFAEMAAEFLERQPHGLIVETATSAAEGLERLAETEFDCIVSDYDMPARDGIQFLNEVRDIRPELPFILYTGKGSEEVASEAISEGVTDYLQKERGTEQYELLANRIRNVVERRRAQRAITESEQQLRRVYERVTDGVFAVDADWEFMYVNDEGARLVHRTVDELLGERIWDVFPELEGSPFGDAFRRAMETQETTSIEEYYPPLDCWFDVRVYGTEEGISIYFQDVTKRKEREHDLELMDQIVREMNDGVVIAKEGRIEYTNPRVSELVGYSEEELLGEPMLEYIAAGHRQTVRERHAARVSGADVDLPDRYEIAVETVDGEEVPVEINVSRIRYYGEPATVSIVRDVSERKQRVEVINQLKQEYETVFETAQDGIFVFDVDHDAPTYEFTLRRLNPAHEAISGLSSVDDTGKSPRELLGPELGSEVAEKYRRCVETREPITYEEVLEMPSGTVRWQTKLGPVVRDDEVTQIVGVARDVTQEKQREAELERFETIIETVGDTMYALDADGCFTFVNEAFLRTSGYTREEIIGQHVSKIVPDEYVEEGREVIRGLLDSQNERSKTWALEWVTKDGERIPAENHVALLPFSDGEFSGTAGILRDTTERRQRESQLERERSRMEFALNTTDSYVYEIDFETGTERRFGRFDRLHNVTEEDITTTERFLEHTVHPDDRATIRAAHAELSREPGASIEFEYRTNPERGDVRWIWTELTVRARSNDSELQGVGLATDVTEQKRREQELRGERDRLRAITQAIPDVVMVFNEAGQYEEILTGREDLLVSDSADLLGMHVAETVNEAAATAILETIEQTLERGGLETVEYSLDLDGTETWFEGRVVPLTVGASHRVLFLTRDITDRVERERTLERIHDASAELLGAETGEEVAQEVAQAARDILGYAYPVVRYREGDQLVPVYAASELQSVAESIPTYHVDNDLAGRALRSSEALIIDDISEVEDRHDRGESRSVIYAPIGDHGVISVADPEPDAFDETDRAFIELLTRTAGTALDTIDQRKALRRQNDRLEQFASILSHDLRNPLNVAQGRLELANTDYDSDDIERALTATQRMETLIEDVLSWAKSDKAVGETRPVELADIVSNCWQTVETRTAELVVETEATVQADPSRLQQLLENLIRNAIEHSEGAIRITVGDLPNGFYVEDSGPGVPADATSEIFDPGYSTRTGGTGFGLAIVEEIADSHGWEISVIDAEAGGARFEFRWSSPG